MSSQDFLIEDSLNIQSIIELVRDDYPEFIEPLEAIMRYEHFEQLNPYGIQAICYLIQKAINENDTKRIYNILFNPQIAPKEHIDKFREWHELRHLGISQEHILELFKNPGFILLLQSGMFGGKSTLAQILCKILEIFGFKVFLLVPDFMDESVVTLRGKKGSDGKQYQEVPAIKIGQTNWKTIIQQIDNEMENEEDPTKAVIQLDEYSFMDEVTVDLIVRELTKRKYRVLLPGLDSDYLGRKLPGFLAAERLSNKVLVCKSYVYGRPEIEYEHNPEPRGTMTVRHIKVNNQWIPDFGFAEVVIPKGRSYARYTPGCEEDHTLKLLENNPELLHQILYPSEFVRDLQRNFACELERCETQVISKTGEG